MSDCRTCRHSIGYVGDVKIGIVKAQDYRNRGYSVGKGVFSEGFGIVCERFKIISPTPCAEHTERKAE